MLVEKHSQDGLANTCVVNYKRILQTPQVELSDLSILACSHKLRKLVGKMKIVYCRFVSHQLLEYGLFVKVPHADCPVDAARRDSLHPVPVPVEASWRSDTVLGCALHGSFVNVRLP